VNKVRLFDIFDKEVAANSKEINVLVDFGAELHMLLWKKYGFDGNTLCLVTRILVSLDQFIEDHGDVVPSERVHAPLKVEEVTKEFRPAHPINGKVGSVNGDEHFLKKLISCSNIEGFATANVLVPR
jgi:hypothetical protein